MTPRKLTTRQHQIFRLFGRGLSYTDIATELGLSPKTVNAHRQNIIQILGFSGSREMLVAAARENGWDVQP